jgi:hypothetical protein
MSGVTRRYVRSLRRYGWSPSALYLEFLLPCVWTRPIAPQAGTRPNGRTSLSKNLRAVRGFFQPPVEEQQSGLVNSWQETGDSPHAIGSRQSPMAIIMAIGLGAILGCTPTCFGYSPRSLSHFCVARSSISWCVCHVPGTILDA